MSGTLRLKAAPATRAVSCPRACERCSFKICDTRCGGHRVDPRARPACAPGPGPDSWGASFCTATDALHRCRELHAQPVARRCARGCLERAQSTAPGVAAARTRRRRADPEPARSYQLQPREQLSSCAAAFTSCTASDSASRRALIVASKRHRHCSHSVSGIAVRPFSWVSQRLRS